MTKETKHVQSLGKRVCIETKAGFRRMDRLTSGCQRHMSGRILHQRKSFSPSSIPTGESSFVVFLQCFLDFFFSFLICLFILCLFGFSVRVFFCTSYYWCACVGQGRCLFVCFAKMLIMCGVTCGYICMCVSLCAHGCLCVRIRVYLLIFFQPLSILFLFSDSHGNFSLVFSQCVLFFSSLLPPIFFFSDS